MSGANHYQPGPDLPAPQSERFNKPAPEEQAEPEKGEKASRQPELPPVPPPTTQSQPAPAVPQTPFVPPPLPSLTSDSSAKSLTAQPTSIPIPVTNAPDSADDSDLIEKEWVYKAKHIVETSRNDPRQQNKEISKLKADYIQKRYNKQLKVSED